MLACTALFRRSSAALKFHFIYAKTFGAWHFHSDENHAAMQHIHYPPRCNRVFRHRSLLPHPAVFNSRMAGQAGVHLILLSG